MLKQAMYAAPVGALLAAALWTGTAIAGEQDPEPTRSCETVSSELAEVQAAAALPVTLGAATFPDLDAVKSGLASDTVTDPLKSQLQAILDAAAKVDVLKQEQTTCTDEDTNTTEPEPTTTTTDPPAEDVDPPYETCAEAIDDGAIVPAIRGIDDTYQANLDADGDGTACEANEGPATPTATDGDSSGTLGGSSSSSGGSGSIDSIPSGSVDTGYVAP